MKPAGTDKVFCGHVLAHGRTLVAGVVVLGCLRAS